MRSGVPKGRNETLAIEWKSTDSIRPCRTLPLNAEAHCFFDLVSAQLAKTERLRCRGLEKNNLRGSLAFWPCGSPIPGTGTKFSRTKSDAGEREWLTTKQLS